VLFGGATVAGTVVTPFADTWEWNGTAWSQRTPTSSPPARSGHGMALDPRRQRIVLFGGKSDDGGDDTWEWNGDGAGAWTRLAPAVIPTSRTGMGFAQDITGGLISIDGTGGGNATIGVMRLTSELSTERVDTCQDATIDSDDDGAKGCADPDCWTRCALCGNATCDPTEDYLLCPADCMAPPP